MAAITQSIGLFGVTGEVGRAFFDGLEAQPAFVGRLRLFASAASSEETRVFRDKPIAVEVVEELASDRFDDLSEAILAVPADVADELAAELLQAGVRVWDATGHLRAHPRAVALTEATSSDLLIVCDDPLTALCQPVLDVLAAHAPLTELAITALSSVSLRGKAGVKELAAQTGNLLNGRGIEPSVWPQQIAFNVLLADGQRDSSGRTARERRIEKALSHLAAAVTVEQIVMPLFFGAMVQLRWHSSATMPNDLSERLASLAHTQVMPAQASELPSPVSDGADHDGVSIARVNLADRRGSLWIVADPIRAGLVRPVLNVLMNVP
ncbi:aspartate-semialdehyde dehydrogenase [Paraperlucidibaca baekdonensis]|uniref:Aspartate-semialdehyde dehydrogenase n=1 Tax=Paraperlucidibaca baekdonensis TaxID=748120 RepID=A0A3E0H1L8_9GAMM|nr:Asd/ArgC dimerization domain-containing protein [Paraperlucidibaca baekdonensis]REH36661.1 aspartate-semialdehyde dehydrogenase [Paraperlucidibaca baekdonensis]